MELRYTPFVALALIGVVTLTMATVAAQESRDGDRILHRYFDFGQWEESRQGGSGESSGQGPGAQPGVDVERPESPSDDAPGLWMSPGDGEWIWTADGPIGPGPIDAPHGDMEGGDGPTELDGETDRVDALDYQASFRPSVVPFKRGGVQNEIRRDQSGYYSAYLRRGAYDEISVGGSLRPGEERFWGTFLVRLQPDSRQRIPSVSPHQRLLRVEAEPRIDLRFERDEAHNFYVSSPDRELVRINIELAVDRHYFDGPLDPDISWDAFTQAPADGVGSSSDRALELIGISRRQMSPRQALERLVEYHRGFEARSSPQLRGQDRYLEITRNRVGVCRHRSLTFMISATALGIETRYIYNEAHAFVEVYWPGQGWRRIDLGGAAEAFNYQNPSQSEVHDGIWDSEFARPESYEAEMAQLASDEQQQSASDAVADGDDAQAPHQDLDDSDHPPEDAQGMSALDGHSDGHSDGHPTETESQATNPVEFLEADGEVHRGESVRLLGRVPASQGAARIEVVLLPTGSGAWEQGISLGHTVTDEQGYFEGEWEVPRRLSLGRWRLSGRVVD